MPAISPKAHPNSAAARATCTRCPAHGYGVIARAKILPNLTIERARLCNRCAAKLGYLTEAFK